MGTYTTFEYSARLFALPSFLEGTARLVDFGTTLNEYNQHMTPQEADTASVLSDWLAVGVDMRKAAEVIQVDLNLTR